jgi:hypothetical protein
MIFFSRSDAAGEENLVRLLGDDRGAHAPVADGHLKQVARKPAEFTDLRDLEAHEWRYFARLKNHRVAGDECHRDFAERQEKGVVPRRNDGHYAFLLPFGEIAMALVTGNAVIFKPSEVTPLVGLKIAEICELGGLPRDLLQVAIGDGSVGAAIITQKPDKIFFTGSVATGKKNHGHRGREPNAGQSRARRKRSDDCARRRRRGFRDERGALGRL